VACASLNSIFASRHWHQLHGKKNEPTVIFNRAHANNGVKGSDGTDAAMTTRELQERFQTRIEEHKKILYKVCNSYCRNRDDREDLAQEITIQLWRSFTKFDERQRFSTWMYRIALNVAISFYRRESSRTRHLLSADERLLDVIDVTASQSEDLTLLHQFIEQLDPLNKALILVYLDGNSYQEMAEILGISETNVATKISRLKKAVKQELADPHGNEKGIKE
jgi:RNA polymerase sigma factor (sigma-70 family)